MNKLLLTFSFMILSSLLVSSTAKAFSLSGLKGEIEDKKNKICALKDHIEPQALIADSGDLISQVDTYRNFFSLQTEERQIAEQFRNNADRMQTELILLSFDKMNDFEKQKKEFCLSSHLL